MPCTIISGGQWGDEGKGKIASYLALRDQPNILCRAGLGPGAGHTVEHNGNTYKLRQIPSGFMNCDAKLLIGAGALINPEVLLGEVEKYSLNGRLRVDGRATVIEQKHIEQDTQQDHLTKVIQSTGSGHGPCLMDRALRTAKMVAQVDALQPLAIDVATEVNAALERDLCVHIEGTNGFQLSVLYGTYPYTVSKDSTASTFAADVGVGPTRINDVVLVFKTFPTRVGHGPFPHELNDNEHNIQEFGTVTGRKRRVGRFDMDAALQAARINSATQIALCFMDRIDPDCTGKTFEQLNREARSFIDQLESITNIPVTLIGTGPKTTDIIDRTQ
ncbi:adenylosuccinate synthetase [Gynuella sunshinyii]|uniref:Adenylosuccinate synthetase n=2 Tax=Gynuella sunshinyii TaxID=1445505 RepID=A0A0C5V0I6_9GAMM|nr:adenylosuccinate synthetase [Gynuella sunshinyii]AII80612.1 adenylosuccinate synthetase [Gynuella sunshinyii YC6258]AJQ93080.1 adenylosuccinate synthase [Gynuella sunshinyii YC6258]